jgi:hypothetical protein
MTMIAADWTIDGIRSGSEVRHNASSSSVAQAA